MSLRRATHVFVIWSQARDQEDRILADLAASFDVLDLVEVRWTTGETFSRNLTRMYGAALPPGSDKEQHCGTGPFLVVVVEDRRARYRLRPTSRGRRVLNANVLDARSRYREWTGGGYRVHASDSPLETRQNLLLLLGAWEPVTRVAPLATRPHSSDPLGTRGWQTVDELVHALRQFHGRRVRVSPDGRGISVRTIDPWWVGQIAGGREVGPGLRQVPVGDGTVLVDVRERPRRLRRTAKRALRPIRRHLRQGRGLAP